VYALRREGALQTAAELGVPVVLLHMQGEARSMQADPRYDDVVDEVHRFLAERVFAAEMAGIAKKSIVLDPGFGFGKNLQHNVTLLARLTRFSDLGLPLLAGLSRKRSIAELTGREAMADRVSGSVAAHLIAAQRGALLLRVHDVAATVDALKVWQAVAAEPLPKAAPTRPAIRWPDED
jgi:dihydropteroate synthase